MTVFYNHVFYATIHVFPAMGQALTSANHVELLFSEWTRLLLLLQTVLAKMGTMIMEWNYALNVTIHVLIALILLDALSVLPLKTLLHNIDRINLWQIKLVLVQMGITMMALTRIVNLVITHAILVMVRTLIIVHLVLLCLLDMITLLVLKIALVLLDFMIIMLKFVSNVIIHANLVMNLELKSVILAINLLIEVISI